MDSPGLPPEEVADAYKVLRRVNGWFFGGQGPLRHELRRFVMEYQSILGCCPEPLSVVDVGSGSGDLACVARDELAAAGVRCNAVALDLDFNALRLARSDGLDALRADALRLPLADQSIDVLLAVKFAHHFAGAALVRLLSEFARTARQRVVVLDIRRHWMAYWGFVVWSRVFTRNRLVRNDGPLSVLRGFKAQELADLAEPLAELSWSIRWYPGFQLALVGQRGRA